MHYTYMLRAINPIDERVDYIGVRSCKGHFADDTEYMSSSDHVHAAIADGVAFEKIFLADWPNREDAMTHEILLHEWFDVARNPKFFNRARQTSIGFTGGAPATEETKAKLSKASTRMHARPGFKEKHKAAVKQVLTPEFCKARGEALSKSIMSSPEYRETKSRAATVSNSRRAESGWKLTEEQRANIAIGTRLAMSNPETRAKVSAGLKKAFSSPEARARLSASIKEAMNRPEVKAKCTAAKKIAMARPDVRAKISAARVELLKDPEARAKLSDASEAFAARRLAFIEQSGFTGNRRTITRNQVDSWFAAHV